MRLIDQVRQPIDRGLGRQVKLYVGEQLDEWQDDDNNFDTWERSRIIRCLHQITDRRITCY